MATPLVRGLTQKIRIETIWSMKSEGPQSKFSQEASATSNPARSKAGMPELRATLEGLVVQPTQFDEWLNAGGERRRKPRAAGNKVAQR
jgi:hypothetical protein